MNGELATIERGTADPVVYRERMALIAYGGLSTLQDVDRLRARMCAAAEVAKRAGVHEAEWMAAARESERALGKMIIDARERGDLRPHGGRSPLIHALPTLDDIGVGKRLSAAATTFARLTDEEWCSELDRRTREGQASFQGMSAWARTVLRNRRGKPERVPGRHLQAMFVDQLARLAERLDATQPVSIPDAGLVRDTADELRRALYDWVARVEAVSGVHSGS
jgi:hypothetical protein